MDHITSRMMSQLETKQTSFMINGEVHLEMDMQIIMQLGTFTDAWHPVL
jgi:hypothetical protein